MPGGRYHEEAPRVAESKYDDDDTTYLVRKLRNKLKSEAKHDSVRDLFDQLDRNGDRQITAIEFRSGLRRLGIDLDDWEVRDIIKHCDLDGDGEISFAEFRSFVESNEMKDTDVQDVLERLREIVRAEGRYNVNAIEDVFEEFDDDYSGSIEADEMHAGLRKFNITLTVAEAEKIVQRFPARGGRRKQPGNKQRIHYRDFVAAIRGVAPRSHGMKDVEGERTSTYAVRKLQQEVERCAKTRRGDLDFRGVFQEMDTDGSGTLDRTELRAVLDKLGVRLSRSELIDIMDFFGKGAEGEIHYDEFCRFALKEDKATQRIAQRVRDEIGRLAERRGRKPDYRRAFAEIDRDDSGSVDTTEFVQAMRNLGLRLSSAEARQLMNMFDENGDGRVSYREFVDFVDAPAN